MYLLYMYYIYAYAVEWRIYLRVCARMYKFFIFIFLQIVK